MAFHAITMYLALLMTPAPASAPAHPAAAVAEACVGGSASADVQASASRTPCPVGYYWRCTYDVFSGTYTCGCTRIGGPRPQ